MSDDTDNKTQKVCIVLKENASDCSIHIGDLDITHLVNEIKVESRAGSGHLLKVSLGLCPRAAMVTVDGYAVVSAIDKDEDAA